MIIKSFIPVLIAIWYLKTISLLQLCHALFLFFHFFVIVTYELRATFYCLPSTDVGVDGRIVMMPDISLHYSVRFKIIVT